MSIQDTISSLGTAIINLVDRKFNTKASTSQFGVVKIGSGITVSDGVISAGAGSAITITYDT